MALDLLRFIIGYQERCYSPSFQDMCEGVGHGRKWVTERLFQLEALGYIRRLPERARAIEVLRPVAIPRAPDGAPLYFVEVE